MEITDILSLGSIVYLKNNHQKMMVLSRGAIYQNEEEGIEEFFDYLACIYPKGLEHDKAVFFNAEDVDEIIFHGYSDDEDKRVKELYLRWKSSTDIKQGIR